MAPPWFFLTSVQFSRSVVSDFLQLHESQHQLPESTQTHVHWVSDAIQPSHPLSSPSPALNLSQHQGFFEWVSSSHQVAKVLEFHPNGLVAFPYCLQFKSEFCNKEFMIWATINSRSCFCPVGICCMTQGTQTGAPWQPRGVGEGGREVPKRGDIRIPMAASCQRMWVSA